MISKNWLKNAAICLWRAGVKMSYEGGLAVASNVALSLLLSLFPFLMLIAALVRFYGDPALADPVVELILGHWPADSAAPIKRTVETLLSQPPTEFFSLGTIVALVLASNGIENARDGLNRAYDVSETRSFFFRRVQGAFFVFIIAVGLIAAAFLLVGTPLVWSFLIGKLDWLQQFRSAITVFQYGLSLSILALVLFSIHYILPDWKDRKPALFYGIIFTIAGILIGSKLFGLYLQNIANYTAIYAGLAGMMIAIIYLYCLSVLILYGAELNAVIANSKEPSKKPQ